MHSIESRQYLVLQNARYVHSWWCPDRYTSTTVLKKNQIYFTCCRCSHEADAYSEQKLFHKTGRTFCFVNCSNMVLRPMLTANKNFSTKPADLFVLWIVQIWCLQAYSLVDITKPRNRTTIYVSYIDMYKWKRNWALSFVAYKIYHSYHVDQSSRLLGVTSFVERSLPQWEIDQKSQDTLDKHVARPRENWQALITFACYDSPSRIKRGASLSDAAIDDSDMSSEDKNSRLPAYRNSYCTPKW